MMADSLASSDHTYIRGQTTGNAEKINEFLRILCIVTYKYFEFKNLIWACATKLTVQWLATHKLCSVLSFELFEVFYIATNIGSCCSTLNTIYSCNGSALVVRALQFHSFMHSDTNCPKPPAKYGMCHNKVSVGRLFRFQRYTCTCTHRTPIPIHAVCPYLFYACTCTYHTPIPVDIISVPIAKVRLFS